MKNGIKIDSAEYPIYITDDFSELAEYIRVLGLDNKKFCIITDIDTGSIYLESICDTVEKTSFESCVFTFKAGEENKNHNTVSNIYNFLLDNKFDRDSVIVALGGGIVGDVAGFVASTFMRGISFIQIPTTLVAQIDSSVGGKVGINFENKKNIIGSFYSPKLVYINAETLNTLPEEIFSAGLSEVVKHGLIMDKDYYRYLQINQEDIKKRDKNILKNVISGSCKIKLSIVKQDERENNIRQILNFGHTVGHAIEHVTNFKLSHGHAVAVGMVAEAYLSYHLNNLTKDELDDIIKTLKSFCLPTHITQHGDIINEIYNAMLFDKKVKNNTLNIIMLNSIGCAYVENNISTQSIQKAISFVVFGGEGEKCEQN